MAFNQNHMIIALLDSLDRCISFIHSQFVSICGNSYVIFKTIERYQTLGQFCWSLYIRPGLKSNWMPRLSAYTLIAVVNMSIKTCTQYWMLWGLSTCLRCHTLHNKMGEPKGSTEPLWRKVLACCTMQACLSAFGK